MRHSMFYSGLLLLFFVFSATQPATGQQDSTIIKLEKLKATQADDTAKVTTLLRLAYKYFIGPKETIPLAKTYSEEAMRLSEKLHYETGKGRANMTLGMVAFRGGNLDLAINFTDKALTTLRAAKDDRACGQASFYQGCNLWMKGDVKKAQDYFRLAVLYSVNAGDSANIAGSFDNAGMCYHSTKQYDSALVYYSKALQIQQLIKDSASMGGTYLHLADLYQDQTNFSKAIDMEFAAIHLLSKTHRWDERISALDGLGNLFSLIGNYTQAKKYLLIAEQESKQSGAVGNMPSIYNKLGEINLVLKDTDAAKVTIDQGLGILKTNNKNATYPMLLMLRGDCEKDDKKALSYYQKALQVVKASDNKQSEFDVLYRVATRKTKSGDTTGVWQQLMEAGAIAQQTHSFITLKTYYSALSFYYEKTGALQQSLNANRRQLDYTDSVNRQEFNSKLAIENAKFDADAREAKITVLEQEKKINSLKFASNQLKLKQRNIQFGSIAIILALALVSVLLFYSRQRQKNRMAIKEAHYEERLRIAHDVHDDLGSGLSRIAMMAQMAQHKVKDNETGKEMGQIVGISRELVDNMRDLVWMLNPDHATLDNLAIRIREFCLDFVTNSDMELELQIPEQVPSIAMNGDVQRNLFLTVKEAVHNVVKHASATRLKLRFAINANQLEIALEDNGVGFDTGSQYKNGNGLKNMERRIKLIGGSYKLNSTPGMGTETGVALPVALFEKAASVENTSFV